jgi:hypothetical protein
VKLPAVYPTTRCKLKMLKLERIKDYLLLEEGQLIALEVSTVSYLDTDDVSIHYRIHCKPNSVHAECWYK